MSLIYSQNFGFFDVSGVVNVSCTSPSMAVDMNLAIESLLVRNFWKKRSPEVRYMKKPRRSDMTRLRVIKPRNNLNRRLKFIFRTPSLSRLPDKQLKIKSLMDLDATGTWFSRWCYFFRGL